MRTFRRLATAVVIFTVGVLTMVGTAPTAAAGGPALAVLTRHDGRTAVLRLDDRAFRPLSAAIDLYAEPTPAARRSRPASVPLEDQGAVHVSWQFRYSMFRLDVVHVTATDGVWVESYALWNWSPQELDVPAARWLRPADPQRLLDELQLLGLYASPSALPRRAATPGWAASVV